MNEYMRNLWLAVRGMPGHVVINGRTYIALHEHCARMESRIARYDHRANAQRTARAARANRSQGATPTAPQSSATENVTC